MKARVPYHIASVCMLTADTTINRSAAAVVDELLCLVHGVLRKEEA